MRQVERLGERGHEFGVVTGERRCGWFDACLVRQTIKVTGSTASRSQARRARRLRDLAGVRGHHLDGERIGRLPAGHTRGAAEADLPAVRGMDAVDARRTKLDGVAGQAV